MIYYSQNGVFDLGTSRKVQLFHGQITGRASDLAF